MSKNANAKHQIRPRFRISCGQDIALGPGKVELLGALQSTGSISEAAKQLGMSYMRAWTLIRTMNRSFKKPVVIATRGPVKGGGGASLTQTGQQVVDIYQQMTSKSIAAIQTEWRQLRRLLDG